jgi:molybdopterin converting factor small subunit
MPRVVFTPNLRRHVECPETTVVGSTVAEALAAVFAENPRLRGYVLDEQGRTRQHVMVYLNGRPIDDRLQLSDAVSEDDEIYVMQALSGG